MFILKTKNQYGKEQTKELCQRKMIALHSVLIGDGLRYYKQITLNPERYYDWARKRTEKELLEKLKDLDKYDHDCAKLIFCMYQHEFEDILDRVNEEDRKKFNSMLA